MTEPSRAERATIGGSSAASSRREGDARRLGTGTAVAGVCLLVALSAAARCLAARSFDAPWIAPDEMVYGLSGRAFWETGHGTVLGGRAPFYGAYPLLVGLPLHVLGTAAGVTAIQCAQAVAMSLTAAIAWAWARPLAGEGWGLVAAALTACLPALAYSGLLMSEAFFLPAGALATWLAARALARPTLARQAALLGAVGLACAARLQGLVLVPVVVTAGLLAAWFGRDARLLRQLAPTWIAFAGAAALWLGVNAALHGSLSGALGAYSVTASAGYDPVTAARWVLYHIGDLYLVVLGIPLLAAGVLSYEAARGREADAGVRALTAVALSTAAWVTVQVGIFASRYVGQLAERGLLVAAPPLFACLAVWLARGMPRPQPATSVIAFAVVVPAVLLPVKDLVTPAAVPDAFMTVPLLRLVEATSPGRAATVWSLAAALPVLLAVLVRHATAIVPSILALVLVTSSALVSSEVARLTQDSRARFFGTAGRSWVDDAAAGPVTYVYGGSVYWNGVWNIAFWNRKLERVVRFPWGRAESVPADVVRADASGRLLDGARRPLRNRYVLAPTRVALFGTPLASVAQQDLDVAGLRLWRTDEAPRLSTLTVGLKPNGDILQPVRVVVYDCRGGRLELTLLGKQGSPVHVARDGRPAARFEPAPGTFLNGSVPAPPNDGVARICTFEIRSSGLAGSTRIEFVRAGA